MRKSSLTDIQSNLKGALDELSPFEPTPEQRRLKSIVQSRLADDPSCLPGALLTRAAAERLSGASLAQWWDVPGFQAWLSNAREFQERIEEMALLGMDALKEVLTTPGLQPSAKVNAAKLAFEVASKFPRQQDREADPMADWSKEDLIKFVRVHAPQLLREGEDAK